MFASLRSAAFRVAGGFAITDFYLGALPEGGFVPTNANHARAIPQPPKQSSSWWPFSKAQQHHQYIHDDDFELTFREDLTASVQDHQTAAMIVTGLTVLMGGPWAAAGSALAVFSDTEEGLNAYLRVKDWIEGNTDF